MDPNVIKSGTFNQIWKTKGLGSYNGFTEQFYAQPLIYTPVDTQYVYVISQQNIAYILDAKTGEIIKHRTIHIPFLVTPDLAGCNDVADCVGSTATGVIDPDTGTWFFTTKTYADQTKSAPQGLAAGRYYIHAVDVLTLEEKPNFPIPLEGMQADNAPWRVFEGGKHHQRPALLQVNNYVYAGFASHCVQWNFTGWVVGWHATEGRIVTKYAMEGGKEATGIGGGIWMSGGGISSDNSGRMFFATGNGYASQLADDPVPGRQPPTALEEAVVNMAIGEDGRVTPTDFFMPWEKRDLDGMDKDLGTSSFVLLEPGVFSTSNVQRIGTVAGKTGKLYFLNLDDLGGYQMGENRKDKILQTIPLDGPVFASAGTYPHDGGYVYLSPVGQQTVAFKFGINSNGDPVFTQAGKTTETAAGRQGVGHTTVTSKNGEPGSGILWISDVDGANLRAYGTVPVDGVLPTLALLNNVAQMKFSRPSFGDGRVYLTSHTGYITAFGSPVNMPLNCSSPYDAGTVPIGNTSTVSITCRAKIPLTINATTLDDSTHFRAFGYTLPKTLAIDETFSFSTNFTPKSVGPLSTNINLQTINGGPEQFATNTPVVVRGVAISLNPILKIQPNVLSFGEVITGEDTAGKNLDFTMENDGQSPLVIRGYKISLNASTGPFLPMQPFPMKAGPFTFVDLPALNSSIPGNGAVSTTVNFNPTADGYYKAYLVITTNGGSKFVGAFGTAGGKPKALLEWQLENGTWIAYQKGVPFAFGPVPLGTQAFRKLRLRNLGGTNLTTSVSKPPVSGALAAVNPLGSIPEGSQVAPNGSIEATLICSPPKSQVNEDPTTITAVWTMNNNDASFGKTEIDFTCTGASNQVGPLDENGQAWYRYLGCFKDANPNRNLEELIYYSLNNTNGKCQFDCMNHAGHFPYAATEYEGECWCGTKRAIEKVPDTFCQYLCKGDFREYCGGDGAYMSLFGDRRRVGNFSTTSSSMTSTTSTSTSTSSTATSFSTITAGNSSVTTTSTSTSATVSPTAPANLTYLGCANEGTTGRALAKDATADPLMTITLCATYCTSKGYPLSGLEYSTECYCGSVLENGSTIGGSTACNMPCGGNAATICGGPGALSVYNNTALVPPKQPAVVPSVGNYQSLGCYTEGVNERALAGPGTAAADMTVQSCVAYCLAGGFKYAGIEYSTECFCGGTIATTAKSAPASECNMLCGGDKYAYCGGPSRLNVYGNLNGTVTSVPPMSNTTSTSSTSPVSGTTTSTTSTNTSSTSTSSTPTLRPGYTYLGCANEGTNGRALAKDATASSTMTTNMCQDYCTGKGYPLSGVEYSTECYCGSVLENGSTIGGSTSCNMPCGGAPSSICGGPGALSVYNNTALVAPKQPAVVPAVGNYISQGCYTEGVNERALAGSGTANSNMTVQSCVSFCQSGGYKYAGIEYSTECFCGSVIATTAKTAPASECNMLCGGDKFAYCGGPGRLNVYGNVNGINSSTTSTSALATSTSTSATTASSASTTSGSSTSTTTTSSSSSATPTLRAGYAYLGCANEGTNGRALAKDATASSTMTPNMCQDYCTGKGYPLSGVEYSTECYCGNVLENGSTIGGSTACTMPCGGAPTLICGGPGALSVYNNTALVAPRQPAVVSEVGNYKSQGCYTEGVGERALAGSGTASSNMTVQSCVSYCQTGGYMYAGIEYSTECFCGNTIATTAKTAPASECNMLCGGDKFAYCGGPGRLNVYGKVNGTTSSSSTSIPATSTSLSSTTTSGTIASSSTTSMSSTPTTTSSSSTATPTLRAGYTYLGCANEGTGGRALSKDATASSAMTPNMCQDYCTGKGYTLSGVEYSTECYCGNVLENGSSIGGSTSCTMPCGGSPTAICGGPGALSVYNNTAITPPKQPVMIPAAAGYNLTG
ncbi:WSC-domain-containing protein [Tuber magnatum]|uniref:WSC-domain-containing protein n=1 Tax=Tuber magnatum TaxID=42249 RepID=A0A317SLA7_9PEZI|nr:WSC-domain-containing protein [Tuber magnatum]